MRIGDLVRCKDGFEFVGIIIDWHIIYNKFGEPVEKLAVVNWQGRSRLENEYTDMLEVINEVKYESRRFSSTNRQ